MTPGTAPGYGPARAAQADAYHFHDPHAADGMRDLAAYSTTAEAAPVWPLVIHGAGALCSLGLVIGLAVWGYGQVMRDVTGVPVVEALDGPMRVAPARPGGQISDHAGLSVNAVKAGGVAEAPADQLTLAPDAGALAAEDLPAPVLTARTQPPPPRPAPPGPAGAMINGTPLIEAVLEVPQAAPGAETSAEGRAASIAAALAAEFASLSNEGAVNGGAVSPLTPLSGEIAPRLQPASLVAPLAGAGGLARSPRPQQRPEPASRGLSNPTLPGQLDGAEAQVGDDLAPVAPGTRLVQLGAFDTVEEARAAWFVISNRFDPLLEEKSRVLQQAEAGGRGFWRLRATGFEDLGNARRFCAALNSRQAECIPVVAR